MRRRERSTFIDTSQDSTRKAFCKKCEEIDGKFNRLVPRFVDGLRDDKFNICSFCGVMEPIHEAKYYTEYEPKGYVAENPFESGTKVHTVSRIRSMKEEKRVRPVDNDTTIPNFAGKEDVFLKRMLDEGAIIQSISDSGNEEDGE